MEAIDDATAEALLKALGNTLTWSDGEEFDPESGKGKIINHMGRQGGRTYIASKNRNRPRGKWSICCCYPHTALSRAKYKTLEDAQAACQAHYNNVLAGATPRVAAWE